MRSKICSCQGLDAYCEDCYGSGFVTINSPEIEVPKNSNKSKKSKTTTTYFLPQSLEKLNKEEVEQLAITIIAALDLKSKKQMQILNSIPFNTKTFRRDFGAKFEALALLETEKQNLRNQLLVVDQEIVLKNYKSNFTFKHYLSDKDVDVTSNRQLKELIREYKRLKQ